MGGNIRLKSAGDVVLEPVHTTGFVKVLGTASWAAAGTCTVSWGSDTGTGYVGPLGLKGSAISEWLAVENEDGSIRYIPSYA